MSGNDNENQLIILVYYVASLICITLKLVIYSQISLNVRNAFVSHTALI